MGGRRNLQEAGGGWMEVGRRLVKAGGRWRRLEGGWRRLEAGDVKERKQECDFHALFGSKSLVARETFCLEHDSQHRSASHSQTPKACG